MGTLGFQGRDLRKRSLLFCPWLLKKGSDNFSLLGVNSERVGIDSMSSGSKSPDLGEMCASGKNDSCEAGDSADEGGPKDYISEVSESSLWASIRDYVAPPDVLIMRTAGPKWNHAKLYGEFASLWYGFLPHEKGWWWRRSTCDPARVAQPAI